MRGEEVAESLSQVGAKPGSMRSLRFARVTMIQTCQSSKGNHLDRPSLTRVADMRSAILNVAQGSFPR